MLVLLAPVWRASWQKYAIKAAAAAAATSVDGGNAAPHSSWWGGWEYVWRAAIVDLRPGGAPPTWVALNSHTYPTTYPTYVPNTPPIMPNSIPNLIYDNLISPCPPTNILISTHLVALVPQQVFLQLLTHLTKGVSLWVSPVLKKKSKVRVLLFSSFHLDGYSESLFTEEVSDILKMSCSFVWILDWTVMNGLKTPP